MIKIAFCDDELSVLNELRVLLDRYRLERSREIEYTAFQSPLELLHTVEQGTLFDILFLIFILPCSEDFSASPSAELEKIYRVTVPPHLYDGVVDIFCAKYE